MTSTCPVCGSTETREDGVCPACGFRLLGPTQSFAPVSVSNDVRAPERVAACDATLSVVRGPQTGVTYELGTDPLSIGRNPQCGIFLNDITVSRLHATVYPREGRYVVVDENSFNGLWVNNANVNSKVLETGDAIQIGTFCLLYQEK